MRIVVHGQFPIDEDLRVQWNRLVAHMECPEVFYTYEWALAAARAYGSERQPLIILGYNGDSLSGVAALALTAEHEVQFLSANTADYCDFVCAAVDVPEFVAGVFEELNRKRIGRIVLANLPRESATMVVLSKAGGGFGYHSFSRKAYRCRQVQLRTPEERESVRQLLRAKRSLQRDSAALARNGILRLSHATSHEQISRSLPEFIRMHVKRFLDTGRVSNLARTERRVFLSELSQLLSVAGWMKFSSLSAGDREIAWNYGFEFAGSWFWYQPTFDGDFSKYFPGFCLLGKIIEEACDRNDITRVDLGLGDEFYKDRMATSSHETVHLTNSRTYAGHCTVVIRYYGAQFVKAFPRFERSLRRVLAHWKPQTAGVPSTI